MPSERIQRRIDSYLDQADEAAARFDWEEVRRQAALSLDPENADALAFLAAAGRNLAAAIIESRQRPGAPEQGGDGEPALERALRHKGLLKA